MGLRVCVVRFLVIFILDIGLYIRCCFFVPRNKGTEHFEIIKERGARNGGKIIPKVLKRHSEVT